MCGEKNILLNVYINLDIYFLAIMGTCASRSYCAQCTNHSHCRTLEVWTMLKFQKNYQLSFRDAPGLFVIPSLMRTSISRYQGLCFSQFISPPTLYLCTLGLHFLSYIEGSDRYLCNLWIYLICFVKKGWLKKRVLILLIYSRLNNT